MSIEDLAALATEAKVRVSLEGSFMHGRISVEGDTIPLNGSGEGQGTVLLAPPSIDVRVLLVTPAPAEYEFSVTINGRTVKERGIVGGGKVSVRFSYPFSAFGL